MDRELLRLLGPGFISMSPDSRSKNISNILKNKLHTISLKTEDNNLEVLLTAHFRKYIMKIKMKAIETFTLTLCLMIHVLLKRPMTFVV